MPEIDQTGKWVAFRLGEEEFAVAIEHVSIIERMKRITRLPQTPTHVEGVVNLRGEVIPVISLRKRLGMPPRELDDETRIIILQSAQGKVGLIVDAVTKVTEVVSEEIEPAPTLIGNVSVQYIVGVVKQDERLVILLDQNQLMA